MKFAVIEDNIPRAIGPGDVVKNDKGIQYPAGILEKLKEEERISLNVYEIKREPLLFKKTIISRSLVFEDGKVKEVIEYENPGPTLADIVTERSRRLSLGFEFDFEDKRGIHRIGTTPQDLIGWTEVTQWAQTKTALEEHDRTLDIVTDTGICNVTPIEWYKILDKATQFRQPIWTASFVLGSMNPIPLDYTDDKWWP